MHQAAKHQVNVEVKQIRVKTNGDYQLIDLTVIPLHEPEALHGLLMVVFQPVKSPLPTAKRRPASASNGVESERIADLESKLQSTKEHLGAVTEQMNALYEETQSASEELQSANEELQSTNEEVMTSREEMQSLNEELLTVNAELRTKNEELSNTTDDMKNLLDGTEIATIFLDNNFDIKRFTPSITQFVNLIQSDIGRPIGDITLNLRYEGLVVDCKTVLATLAAREIQVQSTDEKWLVLRIMPYRTLANLIDGVVITFMDITQLKQMESILIEREQRLIESQEYAESIIATLHEPFLVMDAEMNVVSANRAFYDLFHTTPLKTEKRSLYSLGDGLWNISELKKLLEEILPRNIELQDYRIVHDFPVIGNRTLALNARQLQREKTKHSIPMILLAIADITPAAVAADEPAR
jgi:two-component system CheB/CheR fusion protein